MIRLIRDALVEKIWEGPVNVLALDLLKATRDGAALWEHRESGARPPRIPSRADEP